MEKSAPSDHELLGQWLREHREAAFHTLVERYTALVHATARRTCGDESIATEASQLTFITLAGKASSLLGCASLGGWLHATSMMHARNLIRKSQREDRKRHHLQLAMDTLPPDPTSHSVWKDMEPLLDEALAALPAKDREALLLRFYRSLSIREIATTLGIATAAAQKRVDRATERLRAHLSRRGCQAGGTISLSAAMLTGFAADAQAALPASSILASKALATSAATAGVGSLATLTTFLTATAMKTTSFVPPLVALLAAVTWIGAQRRALASVELESARIRQQQLVANTHAVPHPGSSPRELSNSSRLPTDWQELAALLNDPFISRQFQRQVDKMPADELVQSLREISALDFLQMERLSLEYLLMTHLVAVSPEMALTSFPEKIGDPGQIGRLLPNALGGWMTKEPAEASAWLDSQIAAGKLDSRKLDGNNGTRTAFEANALVALLRADPTAASPRLKALTGQDRAEAMRYAGTLEIIASPEAFAALAREYLSDASAKVALSAQAETRVQGNDYRSVTAYLDAIAATPSERAACARAAVSEGVLNITPQRKFVEEDLRVIREWVSLQAPGLLGEITGDALAQVSIQQQQTDFPGIIAWVSHCHEAGDGEPLLIAFLENTYSREEAHKQLCRSLAEKITDETRRAEILKRHR